MLESILSLVLVYTYPLIFVVVFLASLGFPLPATALLLASGAFVGSGYLSGYVLFLVGWGACILGDVTGYILARRHGRAIWQFLRFERITPFDIIERRYARRMEERGFLLIFTSRFLFTALGPTVNILAGIMRVKRTIFLAADITGEFIYIALVLSLGYSFSSQWETILSLFESTSSLLSTSLLFFFIAYFLWRQKSRQRHT